MSKKLVDPEGGNPVAGEKKGSCEGECKPAAIGIACVRPFRKGRKLLSFIRGAIKRKKEDPEGNAQRAKKRRGSRKGENILIWGSKILMRIPRIKLHA